MANYETEFLKALSMATQSGAGLLRSIREPDYQEKVAMQTAQRKEIMAEQAKFDMDMAEFQESSKDVDRRIRLTEFYDTQFFRQNEQLTDQAFKLEFQGRDQEFQLGMKQFVLDWETIRQEDAQAEKRSNMILDSNLTHGRAMSFLGASTEADLIKMIKASNLDTTKQKILMDYADNIRDGNVSSDAALSLETYEAMSPLIKDRTKSILEVQFEDSKKRKQQDLTDTYGNFFGRRSMGILGPEGTVSKDARMGYYYDDKYGRKARKNMFWDNFENQQDAEHIRNGVSREASNQAGQVASNIMDAYGTSGIDFSNPEQMSAVYQTIKYNNKAELANLISKDIDFDTLGSGPMAIQRKKKHQSFLTGNKNTYDNLTGMLLIQSESVLNNKKKGLKDENTKEVINDLKESIAYGNRMMTSAEKIDDQGLVDGFKQQVTMLSNYLELVE